MDLAPVELRVLGCLVEKQRTTPDQYPLSLNGLRLACNQATNRDPVVDYDEHEIREALNRLGDRGWTRLASGPGSRAAKFRHLPAGALDLADAGQQVTLYEARPTLGGAVQTLPEREGDPEPPPDNGQHIALGCFTEYLRFLDRIGESGSYIRKRLALPVLDEDGEAASIEPRLGSLLRYAHLPARERLRIPFTLLRLRFAEPRPGESF